MAEPRDTTTLLRLFREFTLFYTAQSKIGYHTHPLWQEVAEALGEQNGKKMDSEEYHFVAGPYWRYLDGTPEPETH